MRTATIVLLTGLLAGTSGLAQAPPLPEYPADAGLVDVTQAPYNAVGDGKTDCTAAIQKALSDYPNGKATIYLPRGVYLISDTLKWPGTDGSNAQKRTILEGQGPGYTVLQLKDNCPGFTTGRGKAMIWTGQAPAQRFRNGIRALTVDIGMGNAAAIGVQYIANNQGSMHDVVIRDRGGAGRIGLDLGYTNEQGPCLIRNVTVQGFAVGVSCRNVVDSITLEHLTLTGQREAGLRNEGQCVSVRGIRSDNSVPAVVNRGGASLMTLIDCEFRGSGPAAVLNEQNAVMLARNVTAAGYAAAIAGVPGTRIEEWVSHKPVTLFDAPARTLNLPIQETPDVPWDPVDQWAGPHQFGGVADGRTDCTQAVQKAIDSGKTTLYFPRGRDKWIMNGMVEVRGKVRRITGAEAKIGGRGGGFRVVDGEAPVVRFERIDSIYSNVSIVHASRRTVVISATSEVEYQPQPGAGDAFLEDYVVGTLRFVPGQRIWARQLNCEAGQTKIVNDNAALWILGYKTERHGTLLQTINGGRSEVLGGFAYSTAEEKTMPMFINDNSAMCVTLGEACYNRKPFNILVEERRGDQPRTLKKGDVPGRANGSTIPLYVGGAPGR